jgi:hypothetical protein
MSALDPTTARTLTTALAAGPQTLIAALSALYTALPGIHAVTFLATAPDRSVVHRVGTSDPANLPIGGFDRFEDNAWFRRIFDERLPIVGDTPDAMRPFIPETDDLVAMGYGSTLCLPIVIAGDVRGTVNLLGDAGALTAATLAEIDSLHPIAALIFTFAGISDR